MADELFRKAQETGDKLTEVLAEEEANPTPGDVSHVLSAADENIAALLALREQMLED